MIVCPSLKVVYLRIPKTANRSITRALRKLGGPCKEVRPGNKAPYWRRRTVPDDYVDFFTFMCVRNPYARLASHYRHRHDKKVSGAVHKRAKNWSFPRYVNWTVNIDDDLFPNSKDLPQTWFLDGCRVDRVIRFERLAQSFRKLPFVPGGFVLPKVNVSSSYDWRDFYNQKLADKVYRWAAEDFRRFGYGKNSWKR